MTKLTDYKPLQRNPNKGTQRGTGILEQSVRELGAGRSILVDKNGVILAGNHAQEAFVNAGMDDVIEVETDGKKIVVVKRTDLDAESSAGKKMAIMDNRTSEQGLAWDAVVVEDLLNEIKQDEGELDAYLETLAKDTGAMIGDEPPEDAGAQIDKAEELRVKWGVELGQLWQLGEHRLICGDCTDKAVVDRVMNGEKADLVFTDPPYPNNSDIMSDMIVSANDSFNLSRKLCDGVMFWFWDFLTDPPFIEKPNARHVWHKTNGWQAGHWEAINEYRKTEQRHESWVYSFPNVGEKILLRSDVGEHPTPKPVQLVEKIIVDIIGQVVYDPFLGSGTTLIACERLNRKCRAVEISPAYCAVAIQRWVDMTGQEPVLLDKNL